jgi:hypothetical protein
LSQNKGIKDHDLWEAIERANKGLISADLGGGLIKQRIARSGQGKSGGFRTIIIFKAKEKAFFVYGFAKNQKDNLNNQELKALKKLSNRLLSYFEDELFRAVKNGVFQEIRYEE